MSQTFKLLHVWDFIIFLAEQYQKDFGFIKYF